MKNGEWVVTSCPTLLRQAAQQAGMKKIFRLLDADEGRWRRIVQQHEIREHLQRAVRREARQHRIGERRVLDHQQQTAIRHRFRQHPLDPRHARLQRFEYSLQPLRMPLREILDLRSGRPSKEYDGRIDNQ
jgi:hypothetical protein